MKTVYTGSRGLAGYTLLERMDPDTTDTLKLCTAGLNWATLLGRTGFAPPLAPAGRTGTGRSPL